MVESEQMGQPALSAHSVQIPAQAYVDLALRNKTFYDLINTQEGFLALQGYFIKAARLLDIYDTQGMRQDEPVIQEPGSSAAYLDN